MMFLANISPSMSDLPDTIDEWVSNIKSLIEKALKDKASIILLPELYLMSLAKYSEVKDELSQIKEVSRLLKERVCPEMESFLPTEVLLIFSTGPREMGRDFKNSTYILYKRSWHYQDKIYLTPWETHISPGDEVKVFEFNGLKLAVLVCFDSEHPDLSVILKEKEINLLLIPTATTDKKGNLRVNRCASARAIELGAIVVTNPLVGHSEIDMVDYHEGSQGFFYPAQLASPELTEIFSTYSTGESLYKLFEIETDYLLKLKEESSETKPYHSRTKKVLCSG